MVSDANLDNTQYAVDPLESRFHDALLLKVGTSLMLARRLKKLYVSIIEEECSRVLDHMADQKMVMVTVDHVEQAVWKLFDNRFIEP